MIPTDFLHGVSLATGKTDEITCDPGYEFVQTTDLTCFKDCVVVNGNPNTIWNPDTTCDCKTIANT